ncbi:TPA: DUF3293 domain-containing protein [Candidatus Woesearchaeota archaeon]|nr:DUF3293 domain-containing protein [Candidatus Woesearchaeota archaeon]
MIDRFSNFNNGVEEIPLVESSLSRILQHIEGNRAFGVVSAFRDMNSKKENMDGHVELKKAVRKAGYGYIEMRGGYREETGFVTELSLFIPNITRKDVIEMGKAYDQHSVIYKDSKEFALIGTNQNAGIGKTLDRFVATGGRDSMTLAKDAIKDFFSSLMKGSHKGKKFLFKMQEREAMSFNRAAYIRDEPKWITIIDEEITNG